MSRWSDLITRNGVALTANGQSVTGVWNPTDTQSKTSMMVTGQWSETLVAVTFPASVLSAPVSLKNGGKVTKSGVAYTVRGLEERYHKADLVAVTCFLSAAETE